MSITEQANEHEPAPEVGGEEEVPENNQEENNEQDEARDDYTWWDGQWPAARGKISRDLAKNAGTVLEQKLSSKEIYSFLKDENAQLSLLNGRSDIVAYLVNIPGTKLLRIGYGLSPKVTNLLNPNASTTLRMMTGDVDDLLTPDMISFPSTVKDLHKYRVPSDTMIDSARDNWPTKWPVFKVGELKEQDNGNDVTIMKIAPMPFFVVQDGLDKDLDAGLMLERIQSIEDFETEEYLQHAANFIKACMVQFQANQKKPSLETVTFTARASTEDKNWAKIRMAQFCPDLVHEQVQSLGQNQPNDLASVLKLLLDHTRAAQVPITVQGPAQSNVVDASEGFWEKKLGLSPTALANMLKFCGLKEGEEHLFPQYLSKMAEKHVTKSDKDSIIHQVLSKLYYQDAEVPVTSFLLAVIRERSWTGGEVMCTMANCMKGLSIFAMKDISDEAVSRMNEEEEARDKATHTSPKDHMLSSKWKPEVPMDTAELTKYFQRYVNVLSALTMGQNPHCHHAKEIVGKLKRWNPAACRAMKKEMIASIMWVTLKEARRSFMGIIPDVLPEFDELLDCLDKKKEFVVLDLPAALVRTTSIEEEKFKGPKRPREVDHGGKRTGDGQKRPKGSIPGTEVGQNPLLKEKCSTLLKVMAEHKISLSKLCVACNTDVSRIFPPRVCGQAAFFGQCYVKHCNFKHERLANEDVGKVLNALAPALENPSIIIPQGQ